MGSFYPEIASQDLRNMYSTASTVDTVPAVYKTVHCLWRISNEVQNLVIIDPIDVFISDY